MATKKQEVAKTKDQAQLPEGLDLDDIVKDSGTGVNDMGSDDVAVPYLYVLQSGSPQVDPDNDSYIDGAKAGMFYNNVSEEIFDGRETGLTVIPCAYERKYVEWMDRDAGGGFVAEHTIESGILNNCTANEKGIPVLDNGNFVIETAYHYVYMKNPETEIWEEVIIPMKSTMLKKSRRWNKTLVGTLIPGTSSRAPRWLYPYQLKTVKETKNNNTWSNFDIERLGEMVTADQYRAAKSFAELFSNDGIVKAQESNTGGVAPGAESNEPQSQGEKDVADGEMPF